MAFPKFPIRSHAGHDFLLVLLLMTPATTVHTQPTDEEILENWKEYVDPKAIEQYEGIDLSGRYAYENSRAAISPLSTFADEQSQKPMFKRPVYWKNGTVPYELSNGFTPSQKARIKRAMEQMYQQTLHCVKFTERKDEKDYVKIGASKGCRSDVGFLGGKQDSKLEAGCLNKTGATQHELMHILGFYHEISRLDRDDYVYINQRGVMDNQLQNFEKFDTETFKLPYDYDSVLHYPYNAFAKSTKAPTIVPRVRERRTGRDNQLSILDVARIRLAYNCTEAELNGEDKLEELPNTLLANFVSSPVINAQTFEMKTATSDECLRMATKHCRIRNFTDCFSGFFNTTCNDLADDEEIGKFLTHIKDTKKNGPVSLTLFGERPPAIFTSPDVVQVRLCEFDGVSTDFFSNAAYPSLLSLHFCRCKDVQMKKLEVTGLSNLVELVLFRSTIRLIEADVLENLPRLQLLALDHGITPGNANDFRGYLKKLHCDQNYKWLRDYFESNPRIVKTKQPGELYSIGLFSSPLWNIRDIFFPVDCAQQNLEGSDRQEKFSVKDV